MQTQANQVKPGNHSPTPWMQEGWWIIGDDGNTIAYMTDHDLVKENAALIKAAPALLKVAMGVLQLNHWYGEEVDALRALAKEALGYE